VGKTGEGDPLDVAFLKINDTEGKKLSVAKIGDSSRMQVGDGVIAIGNALGQFQNSVTSGIISGYGRSVEASDGGGSSESLQNLFQTDAAINQGNSGGPLVNTNGEVIGINTAVAGGDAQNIGFSIPINDAKGLIDGVLANGELRRPYLGVQYVQLTPALAEELNLSVDQGAYINDSNGGGIVGGSPAAAAGLQGKDIITKINDQNVDRNNTLASVIGRFKVGDKVTITYIRGGDTKTTEATVGELPTN
jgi:serine protease Do